MTTAHGGTGETKIMSNVTSETQKPVAATQPSEPESKPHKVAQNAKRRKATPKKTTPKAKAKSARKATHKPAPDRSKKAEIIAMMRRSKGVTLAEIMSTTGWKKHTVRGFVSILGKKGEAKVESFPNASGERTYKIPN